MLATLTHPTRTSGQTPVLPFPVARPSAALAADRELVSRASHGDDRAFAELVRRHSARLRAVASTVLPGTSDVDDVVQETFIAAWTGLGSVVDGDAVIGWLMTTARRRSIDRLRSLEHRNRGELVDEPVEEHDRCPDAVAVRAALLAAARRLLDTLPVVQRDAWVLRHVERLGYREIAVRLGIPESTVRGQIARARARLRAELAAWE